MNRARRAPAGNAQVYSYSNSTVASGGPNGILYQAQKSTRTGPGGVKEVQKAVRDGRTGHDAISIARGLGDKERVVTRRRDANGRELKDDVLKGIAGDEVDRFDSEWMEQSKANLLNPGSFGFGSGGRLNGGAGGRGQNPQMALPSE